MSRDLVSPVLVGRQQELGRLRGLLERAGAGEPVVALVAGEAGVGKSRLTREAARLAADLGVRVLSGGCVELGGEGIPLAPLVDMLRSLARSTGEEELDLLLGPARREFARLLPELNPSGSADPVQGGSAMQLLEHVLGLITRLAAARPLMLVVEDLHWADRSTRDLVVFLVQTLRELGVLLLLTYRSDELHRRHPLRPLITTWERIRTVERLELGRFTRGDVGTQLEAIRGAVVPPQFVDVVFERSQGNAFMVEEILAAVDNGADPGDLPPTLRDVLLARTDTVTDDAQRVLRTASAAGHRVPDRLLEAVSGMPTGQLYAALREAVEHHLLVVDRDGGGYAFRHALTRDAVYDDILPGERVQLHATYGETVSADPALLGDDGTVAATLAHHWYAALDLPRALDASVRAGRQAAAAYAPAEALRHLERALQIWPRVPDAADRAGADWAQVNMLAAEAAWAAGEMARGLAIADQVLADPEAVADPVRRAQVVERRAFMLRALGRDEEAARQLRETLAQLPAEPVTLTRAALLASLANSLMRTDRMEDAASTAHEAVLAAAAVGATTQEADALITYGGATCYQGDAPAGLAALRQGLALAQRHNLHVVALRGAINLSDALELIGRHAEAVEVAHDGVALADRLGYARSHGAMLVGNLAEPMMRVGQWRQALDLITESLADDPTGVFASTLRLQRGELHLWQGDLDAADRDLREARRQFGDGADVQFTAPMAYLAGEHARAKGALDVARTHVDAVLRDPIAGHWVRYAWPLLWLGLRVEADAASAPGDRYDTLIRIVTTTQALTPPAKAFQALATAEGARLCGRDEIASWRTAVAAARTAEEAFLLCYSLFRLAEAQCTGGSVTVALSRGGAGAGVTDAATATAAECLHLADALAASTAGDIRALARRARLRIEPAPDVPAAHPDLQLRLTDREREVLSLVAEGRSNGQIATTLFISPKTASVHVSNILAKLDVSSRVEAAAYAHRRGLLLPGPA